MFISPENWILHMILHHLGFGDAYNNYKEDFNKKKYASKEFDLVRV